MFKLAILYIHLLACCVSLGAVLITDWKIWLEKAKARVYRAQSVARNSAGLVGLVDIMALWYMESGFRCRDKRLVVSG